MDDQQEATEDPTTVKQAVSGSVPKYRSSLVVYNRQMRSNAEIFKTMTLAGLELTFPKIPPEDAVGMYLTSIRNAREIVDMPMYRGHIWGRIRVDLADAWHFKEDREDWMVEAREQAVSKRAMLDKQWRTLSKKENDLRAAFQKYTNFLAENEEKRSRSKRRIKYFTELNVTRDAESKALNEYYQKALRIKGMMESKIRQYSMYEDYLNNVVETSKGDFKSAQEIISRYESLLEAKSLIKTKQEEANERLENANIKFRKMQEDFSLKLVGLMNIVNDLMQRYESAKFKATKWESTVSLVSDYTMNLRNQVLRSKLACTNIYKDSCKRKNVEKVVADEDINDQLIFLKKALKDLRDITNLFKVRGRLSIGL